MPKNSSKKKISPEKKTKKELCFVIMPFGGWFDSYYAGIYKPAIEAAGLKSVRADDLYAPRSVVSDIWAYTQRAKIILADLTDRNPNVFYELGLAHALPKPAILLTDTEEDIPFDLQAIRILKYDKNEHDWGKNLKDSIKRSIKEILENPTESIPAPFLQAVKDGSQGEVTMQEKQLIQLRQEVDILKKEVRGSSATTTNMRSSPVYFDAHFNLRLGVLSRGGHRVKLTRKEAALLNYLLLHQGFVVSRNVLMERVWDMGDDPFSNTVEAHIASLRHKMKTIGLENHLETVPGRGYRLRSD